MTPQNNLPFVRACSSGNEDLVRLLLDTGVDVNCNASNVLSAACSSQNAQLVRFLLEKILVPITDFSATLFSEAKGNTEVLRALMDDPRVDMSQVNAAFIGVCQEGKIEAVKMLLEDTRVNPFHGVRFWGNPLAQAARFGHLEIVELLSSDPRVTLEYKEASFGCAITEHHMDIVSVSGRE